MEKRVLISNFQKVTADDMNDISIFPENSLDDVVFDIGIPDQAFTGFPVSQSAPAQVTVGNGRFYQSGKVYFNDTAGGYVLDLSSNLPLVTRRIVAIVVWGTSSTADPETRSFLTDVTTRAAVARTVTTEQWRWATIGTEGGSEGPDPARPSIASNVCVVAWVTLDVNGVVSILPEQSNLAPSVRGNNLQLLDIAAWRNIVASLVATLRSDLSALASRIVNLAPLDFVVKIAEDVARLDEKSNIPTTYSAWGSDHYIDGSQSDTGNVAYLAQVMEGVRFAWAATNQAQIGLLNPIDPNVAINGLFALPSYSQTTRLSQVGFDAEMNIANNQFQTIAMRLLTRTRKVITLGTSYVTCSNWFWWYSGYYVSQGIFKRTSDGAEFVVTDYPYDPHFVRLQEYFETTVTETYWDQVTTTTSLAGSFFAETFLNAQAGYLLEIGLYFSRAAATGDVTVSICQVNADGSPDTTQAIAANLIHVADIKLNRARTPATFPPTLLDAGRRYSLVISTPGNHYLSLTLGNKYAGGMLFIGTTGGGWSQGQLDEDLAFDLVFAQFTSPRVEVNLIPLQLAGGITDIAINADTSIPDGTKLDFQVQRGGVWSSCDANLGLTGLPALLPFKAVFIGSTDIMPGLGVGSNSQVVTQRPRSDLTHISTAKVLSAATATIHVDIRVESWLDGGHDVHNAFILSGTSFGTTTNHSALTTEVPLDDPNARIFHYTFVMSPSVTTFKIKQTGTIDNVVTPYVICERVDVEL